MTPINLFQFRYKLVTQNFSTIPVARWLILLGRNIYIVLISFNNSWFFNKFFTKIIIKSKDILKYSKSKIPLEALRSGIIGSRINGQQWAPVDPYYKAWFEMGLACTREYVFGGVYLIAWIALSVGCVHYKWFCKYWSLFSSCLNIALKLTF